MNLSSSDNEYEDIARTAIEREFESSWITMPEYDIEQHTHNPTMSTKFILMVNDTHGNPMYKVQTEIGDSQLMRNNQNSVIENNAAQLARSAIKHLCDTIQLNGHDIQATVYPQVMAHCRLCKKKFEADMYPREDITITQSIDSQSPIGFDDPYINGTLSEQIKRENKSGLVKKWVFGHYMSESCNDAMDRKMLEDGWA